MSHFSVLVFTKGCPTDKELSDIMMPWHEFECTGYDNEYVVDVDITDTAREEFEGYTYRCYRNSEDYERIEAYDNRFYREPTEEELKLIGPIAGTGSGHGMSWSSQDWGDGKGYRTKIHFMPDGWREEEVPANELKTFGAWASEYYGKKLIGKEEDISKEKCKYGYVLVKHEDGYGRLDEQKTVIRIIDRTNPNKKWDWWCIGGRYSGKFSLSNPHKDPRNMETCFICHGSGMRDDELGKLQRASDPSYTCNGCDGTGKQLKPASKWVQDGNQVCLANVDFDAIKAKAIREREDWIAEIQSKSASSREEVAIACATKPIAHEEWLALPAKERPRGHEHTEWLKSKGGDYETLAKVNAPVWDLPNLEKGQSLDEWIKAAPAVTAFAVVKDGQWYESGSMGWWGCVSDEKDPHEWQRQVNNLISVFEPDTWVTVIDCHI